MHCSSDTRRYALGRFGQQGREEEETKAEGGEGKGDDSEDWKEE